MADGQADGGLAVVEAVVDEARSRDAHVVGITGGVAVGKSVLAASVAAALGAGAVATDGFLLDGPALETRGLTHRKGFPESFDVAALHGFLDRWAAEGSAEAPIYSHLHYDVVGRATVAGERLVLEGLHLGHPDLAIRDRIDLLVHLDAPDDDVARWYLERFRGLRTAAVDDPTAFLHPYRELPAEVLDGMAMDVWRALNLVVLEEAVRPWADVADLVLDLGPDHELRSVRRPGG